MAERMLRFCFFAFAILAPVPAFAQDPRPVVVQPGAPGQPTKVLPAAKRATPPPESRKDVEFMQGMIMHHAQAVEIVALIEARTQNKDLSLLGARISKSQLDEMGFMKRWLELRGEPTEMQMSEKPTSHAHANMPASSDQMLMPGMLTAKQMAALKKAKGKDFDRLFFEGMIQHHNGALVMVKDLFDTSGSGQDAELFNFATDVDSGQRAEIRSMETLLSKKP